MAKPVRIAGLRKRTALPRAAALVLRPLLPAVFAAEAATRAGDPEAGVHDMRVAMKRLREAFRFFRPAFRKKVFKRHRAWVESLNDTLGEVRDRDVLAEALRAIAEKEGVFPPALETLLTRIASEREAAAHVLADELDALHAEGLPDALAAAIEACGSAPPGTGPRVEEFARENVAARVEAMRKRWATVRRETTPDTLHAARIANKKLRYAIEPFRTLMPKEVRRLYRLASRLHDALGDVHDDDAILVRLETGMTGAPRDEHARWSALVRRVQAKRRLHLRRALAVAALLDDADGCWDRATLALARTRSENPRS